MKKPSSDVLIELAMVATVRTGSESENLMARTHLRRNKSPLV
jgi:hypothetical protein